MTKADLAQAVYRISHLTGDFLLRSGQRSHEYFDKYRFESDPHLLRAIAEGLTPLIPQGTEILAGLELGGVPVATALSLATGLPAVFVRKAAKPYGTSKVAEGIEVTNKKVLIIEDVITTGGQVVLSATDLKNLGAQVTDVLCVLLREKSAFETLKSKGLQLSAFLTRDDFNHL
jgi:orotate phosphoribosyltransferase